MEYAYIQNRSNKNWTITNKWGIAPIPSKTLVNDSLEITRYGYASTTFIYEDKKVLISLLDKPVAMASVIVLRGNKISKGNANSISISKKNSFENISHKKFLERLPGIQVRSLGGPGSITTVSLNGGPTSQTKVTINGFDLTNIQTGVTDLSQLPTAFVSEARLVFEGEKLNSSGTQNGILELNNSIQNNSISTSIGSFKSYQSDFKYTLNSKNLNSSFLAGFNRSEGDYKVHWRDRQFKRTNNFFNQNYGSFQFIKKIKPNVLLKKVFIDYQSKTGRSWIDMVPFKSEPQ